MDWLRTNGADLLRATRDHMLWAGFAFVIGVGAAVVLLALGHRWRAADQPLRMFALVPSAVPPVAVVAALMPTVQSRPLIVCAIAVSVMALIYRATMHGFDRVDSEIVAEATLLGYGRWTRLTKVEVPLAALAIRSGVRCAAVASVGLVAVAAQSLNGGLGFFVRNTWSTGPRMARLTGLVVLALLCILVDLGVRVLFRPLGPRAQRHGHIAKSSGD